MTFRAGLFRGIILVTLLATLSGCSPSGSGPLDEEKEPHFLAGKERIGTLDWKGAIECFDNALQINPRSAAAHFELAWIYDAKESDPAAAIYHYEHFLTLRPKAENADLAKQRIMICKQALAQSVSLGPITEKVQKQFEQMTEENKRLTEENKRLHEEVDKWSSYAARLQTLTNPVASQPAMLVRSAPTAAFAQTSGTTSVRNVAAEPRGETSRPAPSVRTHTVKPGETPTLIARRYSVKVDALLAANSNLDPRRLKVGQVLRIPGS
ncbi:MAG TPA: LysM peptidoglycan-binding domain-containing protein [Patescibacteria group bacterium]|nr:LysM peptidoglycan-binding domain-containing protein [Patescibacteria group bacterium]